MNKIKRTFGFIFNHPLGQRHPARSLSRFLWWQLQSSIYPYKLIVKPFIGNISFYARKGLTGITGNIYTGLHEFNDMAFLLHFLRPGDLFYDLGANAGSYTLLASGVCKARTIALEASSDTAALTEKNIILNQLQKRVTLLNVAAGATSGVLRFSKDGDTTNHIISDDEPQHTGAESVSVISVDSLSLNNPPALIKIDVEGYESEVLKGMTITLKQESLKAIIIELNGSGARYGFNEDEIHQLLLANGFMPQIYNAFRRTLSPITTFGQYNTIYCRDLSYIAERIASAPAFTMMGEDI